MIIPEIKIIAGDTQYMRTLDNVNHDDVLKCVYWMLDVLNKEGYDLPVVNIVFHNVIFEEDK